MSSPVTYDSLLASKVTWKPRPDAYGYTPLYYDELAEFLGRSIALGLSLELPVGSWIAAATKKELSVSESAMRVLRSNIGDESLHFHGFTFLGDAYPHHRQYIDEASSLAVEWGSSPEHEILKSYALEAGVFLTGLAFLRLCSDSAGLLAMHISADEQRHVATNAGVLGDLGMSSHRLPEVPASLMRLQRETLDWLFNGFSMPAWGIDSNWVQEQAHLLLTQGYSLELADLTDIATYVPPFENANSSMY